MPEYSAQLQRDFAFMADSDDKISKEKIVTFLCVAGKTPTAQDIERLNATLLPERLSFNEAVEVLNKHDKDIYSASPEQIAQAVKLLQNDQGVLGAAPLREELRKHGHDEAACDQILRDCINDDGQLVVELVLKPFQQ
ncbi:hypothetical protein OC842_007696 [Tilletia horrida]|uniref:Uncharacterized protein n=1 Tax=Tilletia horrida TaxID=155126 RepID=A0AAN6JGW3_9BASI|nr:hypothetical protein OC842_007696 [Tilletia horrida]